MTRSIITLFLFLLPFLSTLTYSQTVNNNPIVGIVTIPAEGWDGWEATSWNYFAASYVKYLEAAGAQVVPVPWDAPTDKLDALLGQLNGLLFTGGGTDFGNATNPAPVYLAFQHIISYVLEQNTNGNFYPLWGTCQGFEIISKVLANNMTVLTPCQGCVYVNTNNFPVATYNSKMLATLPQDLQQKITYANISLMDHVNKLDIAAFDQNPLLSGNVTPVAYSIDQAGTTYVSMYESRLYPIYAVQFHQEKATFEWKPSLNINHDFDAIRFEQYLANFFVQETRKNNNTFPQNATALIDNYNDTLVPDSTFIGVYFFPVYNGTEEAGFVESSYADDVLIEDFVEKKDSLNDFVENVSDLVQEKVVEVLEGIKEHAYDDNGDLDLGGFLRKIKRNFYKAVYE